MDVVDAIAAGRMASRSACRSDSLLVVPLELFGVGYGTRASDATLVRRLSKPMVRISNSIDGPPLPGIR